RNGKKITWLNHHPKHHSLHLYNKKNRLPFMNMIRKKSVVEQVTNQLRLHYMNRKLK
ncbi:hypothetical protein LOAG_15293, partial [Loa loa]